MTTQHNERAASIKELTDAWNYHQSVNPDAKRVAAAINRVAALLAAPQADELRAKGWVRFDCPVCGSDGAVAERPQADELMAQRDELLAVLVKLVNTGNPVPWKLWDRALETIAKVRGGSAEKPWPFTGCSGPLTDCDMK